MFFLVFYAPAFADVIQCKSNMSFLVNEWRTGAIIIIDVRERKQELKRINGSLSILPYELKTKNYKFAEKSLGTCYDLAGKIEDSKLQAYLTLKMKKVNRVK